MPSLPDPVKKGAGVAATILETTAGVLRHVAGTDGGEPSPEEAPREQPRTEPAAAAAPAAAPAPAAQPSPTQGAGRGTTPAAATRSRISNPKAAKKVRARGT
jgi:hypothetical protein